MQRCNATVVSVCCARDMDVWRLASRNISRYICAASYNMIVPDREVKLFVAASPSNYNVLAESEFCQS